MAPNPFLNLILPKCLYAWLHPGARPSSLYNIYWYDHWWYSNHLSINTRCGLVLQGDFYFIFVIFIVLSLPYQDWACLGQIFYLVPQYLVCIFQLVDCFHKMVQMVLIRVWGQCGIIKHGRYDPSLDHSVCGVVYRLPCAHLLGELEAVIFVHQKISNPIHVFLFAGFFLLFLQA